MFAQFITSSGMSRTAWAKRLGISKSYLSDILNGNRTPSLELAGRISTLTEGQVSFESWLQSDPINAASASDKDAA